MKTITTILCICCLPVAAQNSQKVLFENPIVRVVELSNNEPSQYDRYPSLFITVDSIKPAKWAFAWEASGSTRMPPSKLATLRVELKKSPSAKDIPSWPESLDAVHAAPKSHRVLFENAKVRVREVRVPPGTREPFHVHPWPSIFIYLDSGGPMGAQRYDNKDGKITHDHPRIERPPINPPEWRIHWMKPEPLLPSRTWKLWNQAAPCHTACRLFASSSKRWISRVLWQTDESHYGTSVFLALCFCAPGYPLRAGLRVTAVPADPALEEHLSRSALLR